MAVAFGACFGYIAASFGRFVDRLVVRMAVRIRRRNSFEIQLATVRALFFRELQTRFGSKDLRLGYLWALLEPVSQVMVMLVIFGFILARHVPAMDYSVFLLTGTLLWFLFSKSTSRALGAVEGNQGLLNYRPVLPIDITIARTALELIIYFAVYVILMLCAAWFELLDGVSDILLLFSVWAAFALFSFGSSLVMMVVGHFSGEIGKLVSVLMSILYFASGIIFPIQLVPEPYRGYLLLNPLVHAFETARYAVSSNYGIDGIDFGYFLKSTLVVLVFGLLVYKSRERRMMTT